MTKPRLIVIDDEADIGEFIRYLAEQAGYDASSTSDPAEFRRLYADGATVVVLDLVMPEVDGVELIRFLSAEGGTASLILISGFDERVLDTARELAESHGLSVIGTLTKPIRAADFRAVLGSPRPTSAHRMPTSGTRPSPDELREAITKGELVAYFQPKVSMTDGCLAGVETLVRWRNPDRGIIPPDAFIPMAEENGLIDDLTIVVMRQALTFCACRLTGGTVAVNVALRSLSRLELPEQLHTMLLDHGLAPSRFIIEVTESGLMHEVTKALDVLARLRLKGIRLSIDDFGTGYSSMQQLKRVPFTELKIDRSFVRRLDCDAGSRAIVQATIELGHRLGMKVVAEGIETASVWDALAELGCDEAQGYFIAKPMPAEDWEAWYARWQRQHGAMRPSDALIAGHSPLLPSIKAVGAVRVS
jgi:EAL domain-containing protein (putative c-di-GMP-specific phosphodiesterase class I)/ActR/RegA family two-component response regulator